MAPPLAGPEGPCDAARLGRGAPEGAATPRWGAQRRHRSGRDLAEPNPSGGTGRASAQQDSPPAALRERQLPAGMLLAPSGTGTRRERDGSGDGSCPGVSSHGWPARSGEGSEQKLFVIVIKSTANFYPHCSSLQTILKSRSKHLVANDALRSLRRSPRRLLLLPPYSRPPRDGAA